MLAVESQWGAAGGEHLQTRSTRKQLCYSGCCPKNLLEIVEQEEQPPLLEVVLEALIKRLLSCLPHPQCLRDGREEQLGFGQGGELCEEGAVGKVIKEVGCCLQG